MKIEKQGFIFDSEKAETKKKVCMFTSLFKHSSGRIFSSFRLGSRKDSADGIGVIAEFVDESEWEIIFSDFETQFEGKKGDIKVVELFERQDGGISAVLSWFDCSERTELYDASSDTILPAKLILVDSYDMGKSWLNYRFVDIGNLPGPALTGPILRTPNGYFVFFETYGPEKPGGTSCHVARAILSIDGINFGKIITVARHPENAIYYWDQRSTFDFETGKIITMFWTYDRKNEQDIDIHISYTDLKSLTWTVPVSTGIKGQIAAPVPVNGGRLLCFYVHRHYPGSMRLILSEDGGKTWNFEKELVIYQTSERMLAGTSKKSSYSQYWEDMNMWCFGHPSAVFLDDKHVLLSYYAGNDVSALSARYAIVSL
ncbi:MAG: glycoside hydrolase [Candidatus Omnitrophica bacterium]|nr:glycoside hydrolase [Candidatus Omnitrophota bacterium]MCM8815904.1 glycoside hydrolase [Candidatus Omnitrophota bacterium]